MPVYEETELVDLLRLLPLAPAAWVDAAKALPRARRELGRLLPMIEHDAELRDAMTQDLESALKAVGVEPEAPLVEALRRHLNPS